MIDYKYFKQLIISKGVYPQYSESNDYYFLKMIDGTILIDECHIHKSIHLEDKQDFETNYKALSNKNVVINQPPFSQKSTGEGKLFRRKHGAYATVNANSSGVIYIVVPYTRCMINKVEITNCNHGDQVDFKVYDTETGTISTVPNLMLNQFGFNVEMCEGIYIDESNYNASLIQGMKVEVTYKNNSGSSRRVGVNFTLHEVV